MVVVMGSASTRSARVVHILTRRLHCRFVEDKEHAVNDYSAELYAGTSCQPVSNIPMLRSLHVRPRAICKAVASSAKGLSAVASRARFAL